MHSVRAPSLAPAQLIDGVCQSLRSVAELPHYSLRVDRSCRLVYARRNSTPFETLASVTQCFDAVQFHLADIPRGSYQLMVDARFGPSRNDRSFEARLQEERGKLLLGFSRNAALAKSKVGALQIQRYAKQDGREVFVTDTPDEAFEYLCVPPHSL